MHRAEAIEVRPILRLLGRSPVHEAEVGERRALPALRAVADVADEFVSGAEPELVDDAGTNVDVVLARDVPELATSNESGSAPEYLEDAQRGVVAHDVKVWM
jgi:hypothetical protein